MTDHPYAPPVDSAFDDPPAPVDRLACPSCGGRGVSFWLVWICGSLARPRCAACGAALRVEKRGGLRFAGYAIGSALGAALVLNVRNEWFSWWLFALATGAGFALDAWCDRRVVQFVASSPATGRGL